MLPSFSRRLYISLLIKSIEEGDLATANRIAEKLVGKPDQNKIDRDLANQAIRWIDIKTHNDPHQRARTLLSNLPFDRKHLKRIRNLVFAALATALAEQEYLQEHYLRTICHQIQGFILSEGFSFKKHNLIMMSKALFRALIGHRYHIEKPTSLLPHTDLEEVLSRIEGMFGSPIEHIQPIPVKSSENNSKELYEVGIDHKEFMLRIARKGYLRDSVRLIQGLYTRGISVPAVLASNVGHDANQRATWYLEERITGDSDECIPNENTSFADLGLHLKKLHSISTQGFGAVFSEKLDAAFLTFDLWLADLQEILIDYQNIRRIPEESFGNLEQVFVFLQRAYREGPVLCHGDIHQGNTIFKSGKLQALIDWEDVYGNDPAYEFGVLLANLEFFDKTNRCKHHMLRQILEFYSPKEPEEFIRRIYAHRYLVAAVNLQWSEDAQRGYIEFCQSILREGEIFGRSNQLKVS
jgi:thiamine kinase-like enzyme